MGLTKMKKWSTVCYWLFAIAYWEILVHAGMYGHFQGSFRFALGFGAAIALALGALVGFLPRRGGRWGNLLLTVALTVVYGSQMVYCFIFGTPYSVSQIGLGADAVSSFWRELVSTMGDRFPWLLGLLVPLAVLLVLWRLDGLQRPGWQRQLAMVVLAVAAAAGTYAGIRLGGMAMYSDYYFFTSTRSTTAQTLERFGVPMTFYLELTHTEDTQEDALLLAPQPTIPQEEEPTEPVGQPPVYNVLPVDFDALSRSTDNEKLIALNDYCSRQTGTKQNEYTGMLSDYNLILICAESFSPAAVDPEITPTLYKLTHEGFIFNNFYNSFPNTTIDGEYSLLQGLYPDSARGKNNSSMLASAENSLPFALGNIFAAQRGLHSWGYHNNIASYYSRNVSHPNMGYEMQFNHKGMELTGYWPTSDFEMMEQSVDDYIHESQFNVYYMTFSGHYQYKVPLNAIADGNYHLVRDLPDYCMAQKAYLACHIELDKAMEYLLQRLEEEGVADKTAIVMCADHFPYGLLKNQYFQMIGEPEDYFTMYKSNLVFWVGGMEEPIQVDEYCCNVDILPTILNLWGLDYDSRMLPGTDVFSDSPHVAVLIDHSFLTDQAWFNANTGEIRYQVDEREISPTYVEDMNRRVAAQFDFSQEVLRNDYYGFVFPEPEEAPEKPTMEPTVETMVETTAGS